MSDESCLGIVLKSAGWIALDYMIPGLSHTMLLHMVIHDIFAGKYGAVKEIQQAVAQDVKTLVVSTILKYFVQKGGTGVLLQDIKRSAETSAIKITAKEFFGQLLNDPSWIFGPVFDMPALRESIYGRLVP